MSRIYLLVPFAEKDEARRLGAHWDGVLRVWYVPDGADTSGLERWLPKQTEFNVRSSSYFIAETKKVCWKCAEETRVFCFVLAPGHEIFGREPLSVDDDGYEIDEEEEHCSWLRCEVPTIVHYVDLLLPSVAARINTFSRNYRIGFSKATQSSYWMNHCERCGMKQGDFEMFCEPKGAFFPMNKSEASKIVLHEFSEPFECNSDVIYRVSEDGGESAYYGRYLFRYMCRA